MIKYLVGAAQVKFAVLDKILPKVVPKSTKIIALHIDANAILYRLYRKKDLSAIYSVPTEEAIRDVVVNMVNVLGHYRRYAVSRLHRNCIIHLYHNTEPPAYQRAHYSEYDKSLYEKFDMKHIDYGPLNMIMDHAMKFIGSVLQYVDHAYLVDNTGVDNIVAIDKYIDQIDQAIENTLHIIFSRSMLAVQLLKPNIIQLYNKRDNSYVITESSAFSMGILKDKKTQAPSEYSPKLLPFIWMLGGCPDVDMEPSQFARNVPAAIKLLVRPVLGGEFRPHDPFGLCIKAMASNIPNGHELISQTKEMFNRYIAVSTHYGKTALRANQIIRMDSSLIDLYDQNSLEEINNLLSEISADGSLLELQNLNMSYNPD